MLDYDQHPYRQADKPPAGWVERQAKSDTDPFEGNHDYPYISTRDIRYRINYFAAIFKTFGHKFGYYNTHDKAMRKYVDPIVDLYVEIIQKKDALRFHLNIFSKKKECTEDLLKAITNINRQAQRNFADHGGKFAAGNKITIADFVLASMIDSFILNPDSKVSKPARADLDSTPKLKSYLQTICKVFPEIILSKQ